MKNYLLITTTCSILLLGTGLSSAAVNPAPRQAAEVRQHDDTNSLFAPADARGEAKMRQGKDAFDGKLETFKRKKKKSRGS
jgi:hypothetical protein